MATRCEMASWLCIAFTSWFVSFGAMAICMITLDQSVSGTYFWNLVGSASNDTQVNSPDSLKAKTISDTQLISRCVIYIGLSTILSVFLIWICSIRQINTSQKLESECKKNRIKINALSDHITDGKTRVIVENMDDLVAFLIEVKAGNDRCEILLNRWYELYLQCMRDQAYFAYSNSQRATEIQDILRELLEGYRAVSRSRDQIQSRPVLERLETSV